MRAAPAVSCAKSCKKLHTSIQGSGEHPTFPAQWFYDLSRAHPGVSGSSRLRRLRIAGSSAPGRADLPSADLTPTIEASGPHDFAVRFDTARPHIPKTAHGVDPALQSLFRARCRRVHRNPIPTFGDDGRPPFLGDGMAGVLAMICPTAKAKICPSGCFVAAAAAVGRAIRVGPEAVTKRAMTL